MTTQSLRFICSGGFHLHEVLGGIAEAPDALLDLLTNAPFLACEQVFQAAVREEVDFVLLTGDLLDAASGGPRAIAFLRSQFELLDRHGIPVFWAASKLDLSTDWLEHVDLPDTVHVFSDDNVERKQITVNELPVGVVLGRSWNALRPLRAAEFSVSAGDTRCVAVVPADSDLSNLPARIAFWTCGGDNAMSTQNVGPQVLHVPGWPQGLRPQHIGDHGCTLVHIDSAGDVRTRRIETDVVRWAQESIVIPENASLPDIRNVLRQRMQRLATDADRVVLVRWILAGDGWLNGPLANPGRRNDLLQWLRDEFGRDTRPTWAISLDLEPPAKLRDEWTDEDTILGDYLRIAREYLEDESKPLALDLPPAARHLPEEWRTVLMFGDAARRSETLREAALVGAGLLRGEAPAVEIPSLAARDDSFEAARTERG